MTVEEDQDTIWNETRPSLENLDRILQTHFGVTCTRHSEELGRGSFARCFRYTLATGSELAARVILPIRKRMKTEVEVATMTLLRGAFPRFVPKATLKRPHK